MKIISSLFLSVPLAAAALFAAGDAHACGGCAVPTTENTQVTGHRMIFSTSKTQTTLYDQIEYTGEPTSFAWFLPIKGKVDVGLSADGLFAFLGSFSSVQVLPPPLNCPAPPPECQTYDDFDEAPSAGGGDEENGGVNIIAQETVGPYETVQLEASDPAALQTWFENHGYGVADDVLPVINAYQQEGFGFLAMKLVPGEGVSSMRPVRVTAPGASLAMPLRMVAAGTGALTPITLFVVGEGRHEAANFPNLEFDPGALVFHWDDGSSNYEPLIKALFESSKGFGWLTQSAAPLSQSGLTSQVQQVIDFNPGQTGWGDPDKGVSEMDDALADLKTMFSGMQEDATWLTRMHAQLARPALANDLELGAESSQKQISRTLQAKFSDGKVPECPTYDWCSDNGGGNFNGHGQDDDDAAGGKGSCALPSGGQSNGTPALLVGIALAAAATTLRRRRN